METLGEEDGSHSHLSDYHLTGRIRRLEPEYRVNLTMVWCLTGETVWAEGFSGDICDPLTFADEIVNAADAALRFQLNAYDARRLADRDESEFSISELLTKAAEVSYRISIPDFQHALTLIDRALVEHPDDSMALAMRVGLGVSLAAAVPEDLHDEDDNVLTRMADRAIERNNQSDYAFFARAQLRLLRLNDIEGALADSKRCLDLSPSYVDGIEVMGSGLLCMERIDQAIEHFKQSVTLSKQDTFHAYHLERLALARFFYGDLDNALVDIDSALQLHPGVWMYHRLKAAIFARQGKGDRAKKTLGRALDLIDTPHILAVELPLPRVYQQVLDNSAPLSSRIS